MENRIGYCQRIGEEEQVEGILTNTVGDSVAQTALNALANAALEGVTNASCTNTGFQDAMYRYPSYPSYPSCPNCGYCPHCGRSDWRPYYDYRPYPYYKVYCGGNAAYCGNGTTAYCGNNQILTTTSSTYNLGSSVNVTPL